MATNGRNSVSSRFNGLADAVLSRFRTEGGSYSQSLILPSAATEGVSASALSSQLRGAPGTGVSLRIDRQRHAVDVKLGASADGIAVDIGVSEGELSEDERLAIAGLAKSFQDAVDGLGSVPPGCRRTGQSSIQAAGLGVAGNRHRHPRFGHGLDQLPGRRRSRS